MLRATIVFFVIALLGGSKPLAIADETVTEKAKDQADQAKVDTNKAVRKAHKKHRAAVGDTNVAKDAGDTAKNVGDDVSHEAKKTKEKID